MAKLLFSLAKALVPSAKRFSQIIPGSTLGWLGLGLRLPNPRYTPPPMVEGQQLRVGPFMVNKRLPEGWYKLAMPSAYSGTSVFHRNQLQFADGVAAKSKRLRASAGDMAFIRVYNGTPAVDIARIVSHRRVTNGYRFKVRTTDGIKQEIRGSCLHAKVAEHLRQYVHSVRHDPHFSAYAHSRLQKMDPRPGR